MMKRATWKGWLLETRDDHPTGQAFAWVSDPKRYVVGFGVSSSGSQADAVRLALRDAGHHYRKDDDALTGLEAEYFGPMGMLATSANAASGQ